MRSTATLADLRTRTRNLLLDTGASVWVDAALDAALQLALAEYTKASLLPRPAVRPHTAVATLTPGAGERTISLAALTNLVDVQCVCFPYTASDPEYPPRRIPFYLTWDEDEPRLYLDTPQEPDGIDAVQFVYRMPHTLNGLDGAVETTFEAVDEQLIVLGAAGYACMERSVDLAETVGQQAVATPNLAAIGTRLLKLFRTKLEPRSVAVSRRMKTVNSGQ